MFSASAEEYTGLTWIRVLVVCCPGTQEYVDRDEGKYRLYTQHLMGDRWEQSCWEKENQMAGKSTRVTEVNRRRRKVELKRKRKKVKK